MSQMFADPGMPPGPMMPPPEAPPGPMGAMTMPPDPAAGGLPVPPGGGGMPPPMDMLNQGPVPGDQGLEGLLQALGGGGQPGAGPPGEGQPEELLGPDEKPVEDMDPIEHLQMAMKHLMMALAKDEDDERGVGITKGMGALQGILGGEAKANKQLAQLGG